MPPVITIFTRHSTDCPDAAKGGGWKRCDCWKFLPWYADGKQHKKVTKARTWKDVDTARRDLEKRLDAGKAAPVKKTLDDAIQTSLSAKETDEVDTDVLGRFRRELARFSEFMAARQWYYPADIDLTALIDYWTTWAQSYPSPATRAKIQARLREFPHFGMKLRTVADLLGLQHSNNAEKLPPLGQGTPGPA